MATMLDPVEETFNMIALSIEKWTEANWVFSIAFRGNVSPSATLIRKVSDCIRIIGFIRQQHVLFSKATHQLGCDNAVVLLSTCQYQLQG